MLITITNEKTYSRVVASSPEIAYSCARVLAGNVGSRCLPIEFESPLVALFNFLQELEGHEWNHLSEWTYSAAKEMAQVAGLRLVVSS